MGKNFAIGSRVVLSKWAKKRNLSPRCPKDRVGTVVNVIRPTRYAADQSLFFSVLWDGRRTADVYHPDNLARTE